MLGVKLGRTLNQVVRAFFGQEIGVKSYMLRWTLEMTGHILWA
jgi:hypothetical protein